MKDNRKITPGDVKPGTNSNTITPDHVKDPDNMPVITSDNVTTITGNDGVTPVYVNASGKRFNAMNLKPFNPGMNNTLTTEEAQRRGRLGAAKSAEVRRQRAQERRTAQDILKAIAEYQMTDDQVQTVIGDEGRAILGDDKAAYAVMLCRQLLQGMDGDTRAAQFVRDTMGDAPVTKTESVNEIITSDDVSLIESVRDVLTG